LIPFPRSAGDHLLPLWREFGKPIYSVYPELDIRERRNPLRRKYVRSTAIRFGRRRIASPKGRSVRAEAAQAGAVMLVML
jgi:hypothetical protein